MVPPNHPILIGFSIIFTIHFGVPLYLETPIYLMLSKDYSSQVKGMNLAHKRVQFASLKSHPLIPDSLLRKSLG